MYQINERKYVASYQRQILPSNGYVIKERRSSPALRAAGRAGVPLRDLLALAISGNGGVVNKVASVEAETAAGKGAEQEASVGTVVAVLVSLDPGITGLHDCGGTSV
jgi:hypothetical protein